MGLWAMGFFSGLSLVPLLALPSAPTHAQDRQAAPPPVEVTEDKLRAFASATLALEEVAARHRAEIAAAETADEEARLEREAERERIATVEATPGITLDEYNAISTAARADPDLAEVVDAAILAELD